MTFLLDTNTCIEILNQRNAVLMHRFTTTLPSDIVLCTMVQLELYPLEARASRPCHTHAGKMPACPGDMPQSE